MSDSKEESAPMPTRPELDRLSLEQALRDFEIAGARVRDLTQRLLESERKRAALEDEIAALHARLQNPVDTFFRESPTYAPAYLKWRRVRKAALDKARALRGK